MPDPNEKATQNIPGIEVTQYPGLMPEHLWDEDEEDGLDYDDMSYSSLDIDYTTQS
tara:strand:- start:1158 stop:1325 length:168 start_codon:yes stop_codon:yes gene_type:complete